MTHLTASGARESHFSYQQNNKPNNHPHKNSQDYKRQSNEQFQQIKKCINE